MMGRVIRPLEESDESEALAAHRELAAENFEFLLDWEDERPWREYLHRLELERQGLRLAPGRVAATFVIADVDGCVAGRLSVRHSLTPWLAEWGGHIGFGVRPRYRRRGVASALLKTGLQIAAREGVPRALLTCDLDNAPSRAVIERCGGMFERLSARDSDGTVVRRYWLNTDG